MIAKIFFIVFIIAFVGFACYCGYLYVTPASKNNERNIRMRKMQSHLDRHKDYFGLKDESHESLDKREIYAISPEKLGID